MKTANALRTRPARLASAGLLAAGAVALSLAGCTPPAPYAGCGNVGQQPNSDVGAWQITQHGANCSTARSLAAHVNRNGPASSYLGWHCVALPTPGLGTDMWCGGPAGGIVTFNSV
jgi:hypothetical protein